MKFLKNKVLKFVVLALVFSVAVSCGCGGGGGGHYSGDFGGSGDSSENTTPEDFTTEYVSPDVMPAEPEEPALSEQFGSENGDDEYGDVVDPTSFTLLTKTTWSIDQINVYEVVDGNDRERDVIGDNNYITKTVTFLISGTNGMAWAADTVYLLSKQKPIDDDLIVEVQDPDDPDKKLYKVSILRPATGFFERKYDSFSYYIANLNKTGEAQETIQITESFENDPRNAKKLLIENTYKASTGKEYITKLHLSRLDNFLILDQTPWQIKSIQIYKQDDTPKNCTITSGDQKSFNQIYLRTSLKKNIQSLNYNILDGRSKSNLVTQFKDRTIDVEFLAPFLRPADGFKFIKRDNGYDIFEAVLNNDAWPGQEFLYVSDYGPNANVVIYNNFSYVKRNQKTQEIEDTRIYWARLELAPYGAK